MTAGKKDKGKPVAGAADETVGNTPDQAKSDADAAVSMEEAGEDHATPEASGEVDNWPLPESEPVETGDTATDEEAAAAIEPPADETPADHVWPAPDADAQDDTAPGEPRTVFMPIVDPAGGTVESAPGPGEARTVFMPPARETTALPPAPPPPPDPAPVDGFIAGERTFFPRRDGGGIQVGDVLNHIFEVTRFIARGGMGEVFEGANVSSGERVAIKVMLPSLAADANVQAMFKREARTLTRLGHPALVQYRVMAQEPQLGVLYIVTEYIDGTNLSDVLGELKPTPAQIRDLGKRLADGLRVAHALDAIHRDISPDNVLLEDGRLDRAKIIDFGIAKDLNPTNKTIVGDGFAGKLNYVAPEQLGDFGRDVGPWSDVFSLGLVLLAVARGRDPDMGATLVDAVDRRREGPDLSDVPEEIRSVLAQMLVADPAQRLRSMDAVIAAFDGAPAPPVTAPAKPTKTPKAKTGRASAPATPVARNRWLLLGGGGLALIILIAAAVMLSRGNSKPATPVASKGAATPSGSTAAPTGPADATARSVIAQALPGIECSWITTTVSTAGGGVNVNAAGVARDTAGAQGAISRALEQGNVQAASMNFDDVAPMDPGLCAAVDALRSVQSDANRLSVQQPVFEMNKMITYKGDVTEYKGKDVLTAPSVITIDPGPDGSNMALFGIEQGNIELLSGSRQDFLRIAQAAKDWTKNADGSWRLLNYSFPAGLKGALLLTSPKPIDAGDLALLGKPPGGYNASWAERVSAVAKRQGWKAEIVWYRVVDNVPNSPAP